MQFHPWMILICIVGRFVMKKKNKTAATFWFYLKIYTIKGEKNGIVTCSVAMVRFGKNNQKLPLNKLKQQPEEHQRSG